MGLVIRKSLSPIRFPMGEATFLLHRVSYAMKANLRATVRDPITGAVDEERYARELHKAIVAGWEGLRYEDTGEAIPFGPCPTCAPRGGPASATPPVAPAAPGSPALNPGQADGGGKGAGAPFCPDCGGTGDCREWALRYFPDGVWVALSLEATRVLTREEEAAKN